MNSSFLKNAAITIILGLIGSALWAGIANYIGPSLTTYFVNVSESFSDKIYLSISSHDLVTLQQSTYYLVVSIALIITIVMCICSYFAFLFMYNKYLHTKSRITERVSKTPTRENSTERRVTDEEAKEFLDRLEKSDKWLNKVAVLIKYLLPVVIVVVTLSTSYSILTTKYVYEAISYFDYLLNVNASNLDSQGEKDYMTRFTQIRSSKDYNHIIVELEKRALQNNLSFLPNPSVRSKDELEKDHPNSKSINWNELRKSRLGGFL
ncbi:hypothetical protein OHW66_14125 [Acinetobacter baumannii]|nr:hypothetical protein [Acinetobacter baumannii]